jgi:hypothetical protein
MSPTVTQCPHCGMLVTDEGQCINIRGCEVARAQAGVTQAEGERASYTRAEPERRVVARFD